MPSKLPKNFLKDIEALIGQGDHTMAAEKVLRGAKSVEDSARVAPIERLVAQQQRKRNVTQMSTDYLKGRGYQIIEPGKTLSDNQFAEQAKLIGADKSEKILKDREILKARPWGSLGKGLLLGAGFVAGGSAIEGGISAISSKTQDLFQQRAFEEMLKIHPKLQLEDPQRVRTFFNTLWNFAPDMAKDPLVAGTAVYQAMKMDIYGGYPVEAIKTVVEIQHKKSDIHSGSPFGRNLSEFLGESGKKQIVGIYS